MMTVNHKNNIIKRYILTLAVALMLGLIFLRSFYWPVMGEKRKLIIGALTLFFIVFVPVIVIKMNAFHVFVNKLEEKSRVLFEKTKECKWKVLYVLSVSLLGIGLTYLLSWLTSNIILKTAFNIRLF